MAQNQNKAASVSAIEAQPVMHVNPRIEKDRQLLLDAGKSGKGATLRAYLKLSGPGWLQSGVTLGGGSLATSLYLGVLVGFSFLWLQPFAMIIGIIMLAAISYVTLSTGERPLHGINQHVSPVLGWGWLIGSMIADQVWAMPQIALGTAALRQNLLPGLIGPAAMGEIPGKIIGVSLFLALCLTMTMTYSAGGRGVKVFEILNKSIVSIIVLSFIAVVVKLSIEGKIIWGDILTGLIPDFSLFVKPAGKIMPNIQQVTEQFRPFWTNMIVGQQRDVIISCAATAVGINMTFLLPYSMLRKGWDKYFRGLAIFDLSTGLFIPFIIATGCVVIASSSQFHAVPAAGFVADEPGGQITVQPAANLVNPYKALLENRVKFEIGQDEFAGLSSEQVQQRAEELPWADKKMAAMLVKRDAFNLAATLEPLTGPVIAQFIFGLGVLFMGLSAATMHMTINGLCFAELLGKPPRGWPQRCGSLLICFSGIVPFFWKDAAPYLAVPTSIIAMVLLPIGYLTFLLLMNQKAFLGDNMPSGGKRILWNILMIFATGIALFGSIWSLWSKLHWRGIGLLAGFVVLCIVVRLIRPKANTVKTI
jgi:Mn2+/Fe2+ NRAMP family transporter